MKKIVIIMAVIVLLIGGFFIVKNRFSESKTSAEVTEVKLKVAEPEEIVTGVNADGVVKISNDAEIKANINGIIKNIVVQEGDRVKEGEEIIYIDDELLKNKLDTAELDLQEARANYNKLVKKYNNQDKVNNLKLEDANRNLEIAELTLTAEKIRLEEQKKDLQMKVKDAADALEKAENTVEENKHLYENGAIPEKTLKKSIDESQSLAEEHKNLQQKYDDFINKTLPGDLHLARLKVEKAKTELDLLKESLKENNISADDLKMARIPITKYEKDIADIKGDLQKTEINSPLTGTVIDIKFKNSDKIQEGNTLAVIADLNNLIVEALVDEIYVNEIEKGQEVKITSDAFAEKLSGRVNFIAPTGTKSGNINKYRTEILIDNKADVLHPGMFVNTDIITAREDNVMVLPPLAIRGEGEEQYVYIINDGKAEKRNIETGLESVSKVEVRGIREGEKVIIGPFNILKTLKDGQTVTGINAESR